MADKIQIRRGNKSALPTLADGETAIVMDDKTMYAGIDGKNYPVGGAENYSTTPKVIGTWINGKKVYVIAGQTVFHSGHARLQDFFNFPAPEIVPSVNINTASIILDEHYFVYTALDEAEHYPNHRTAAVGINSYIDSRDVTVDYVVKYVEK